MPAIVIAEFARSVFGIAVMREYVSVAVAFIYPVPVRAEIDVRPASAACFPLSPVSTYTLTAFCVG